MEIDHQSYDFAGGVGGFLGIPKSRFGGPQPSHDPVACRFFFGTSTVVSDFQKPCVVPDVMWKS